MSHSYIFRAVAGLGLVAALALPGTASAYSFLQTPDGTALRWYTNPVPYQIGPLSDDLPEDVQMEAIFASFEAWEEVPGVELKFEFVGSTDLDEVSNDAVNVVYFQKHDWPAGSSAIGTTQSYALQSGQLTGFDLRLNDSAYQFTADDDQGNAQTDLQNALTHEVGHILGLDHSVDPEATMYSVTSRGDLEKRTLSLDDEEGAFFLYGDGDFYAAADGDSEFGCGCSTPAGQSGAGTGLSLLILGAAIGLGRRRS